MSNFNANSYAHNEAAACLESHIANGCVWHLMDADAHNSAISNEEYDQQMARVDEVTAVIRKTISQLRRTASKYDAISNDRPACRD